MYKNVVLNKEEVEKFFEEGVGFGITYHGENDQGRCVLSAKFKDPKIEEEKNKLIEGKFSDNPQEVSRCYQFRGDGVSYSAEKTTKDRFFKESYYEHYGSRIEEEKKQIIERNQKRREKELTDKETKQEKTDENSSNYDKEDQSSKKETSQQSSLQNNKANNKNIYYGVSLASFVLLVISVVVVWAKKKRKLK